MCGLAGFIDFRSRSSKEILVSMTDTMQHRGPNDSGYEFIQKEQYQIGLGQRRLSIMDLSELGHQPYFEKDKIIIYNGEIYNFKEIKRRLIKEGVRFKSDSDTEVLIKSLVTEGFQSIKSFIGMFAFVYYDPTVQKLYLVRDRAGVKPLYYYWKDDLLLFGSELKSFHKHPHFSKELDFNSLSLYFKYSYIPTPYSIFKNTKKLEAGHILEFDLNKKNLSLVKYWDVYDFYNKPKLSITYEDALSELGKLFHSSFNYRMVSDVPVGVFLSGGYDSTAVASILQKDSTQKIKTFTIGFGEEKFNEAPHAKKIASLLGTDHTEYYCNYTEALEIIPKLSDIYDEPLGDNSVIPTTLVSQLAVKDVTVALSADGGDEVFGGYTKFLNSVRLANSTPKFINRGIANMMKLFSPSRIPLFKNKYNFTTRYEKLKEIWEKSNSVYAMDIISQFNLNKDIQKRFKSPIDFYKTSFDDSSLINQYNDEFNRLLAIDYKTFLLDNNLAKVDRATMSVSLEGREPLLDHRIIEFVSQLPSSFKFNNGDTKRILKDIVHMHIPSRIMQKPKMGFVVPIHNWFKNELKGLLHDHLNSEKIVRDDIFNNDEIKLLINNYLMGKGENVQKIWHLLVFQLWKEKWM